MTARETPSAAPAARRPLWIVCDHCGGAGRVMTVNGEGLADKALADARASLPPNGYPLIRAVKNLCDATGLRLRDAKDLIDQALLREGMTQGESDV